MSHKTDYTTHCAAKQIYDVDKSLFANNQRYIAAVHESAVGTFEKCRRTVTMSVYRGKAECAGRPARSRWCKSITMKE
jgi:hypothetical protein